MAVEIQLLWTATAAVAFILDCLIGKTDPVWKAELTLSDRAAPLLTLNYRQI